MNFRIGHGYDVHRLVPNRPLIIGGVSIPHSMGLDGHSDADVLAHAIADALLGSVALGDIGKHFPDTDPAFKNANSLVLLRTCYMQVVELGYIIGNLDATIIAQTPKMAPYLLQMRQNLAHVLECSVEQINVKATTEEHLGFTGEKLGISAHCVCLIEKNSKGL